MMKTLSATAIALGGEEISVTRTDGTLETVKVRLLKIKELAEYMGKIDDETSLAAFLCGREPKWADTLSLDSVIDIIEFGHALNFNAACRWANWQAQMMAAAETLKKSHPALSASAKM